MPKEFSRSRRVADQIQKELSDLIRREIRDPRLSTIVTVVDVEVSKDLSLAKVFITVLDDKGAESVEILNRAAGFLRKLLGKAITMRKTPELRFILDDTAEKGASLSSLIDRAIAEDSKIDSD